MIKQCPECERVFEPRRGNQKFCRKECRVKYHFRKYYQTHKAEHIAHCRQWRAEHREQYLFSMKKQRWHKAVTTH